MNLAAGGVLLTSVVGGAPESQTDPDLGTNGTLRFPRFGNRAARVNNVNTAFAQPLSVVVTDSAGTPVPGVQVTFAVPSTGASATLSATTATTDATGTAQVTATANATPGAYTAAATIPGIAAPVSFALDNLGPPTSLAVISGNGQSAAVATGFTDPLIVEVRDTANQLLPDIAVTFTAPALGASETPSPTTVLTGADGQGSLAVAANTIAGGYTVEASVSGIAGGEQSAEAGTAFAAPLIAEVRDAHGNLVPGAVVGFSAPGSGPSATVGATATAGSDGRAQITPTAGTVAGSYSVTATAGGATAAFPLTNLTGPPSELAITAGDAQSAAVTQAFAGPLTVRVTDAFDNPIAGAVTRWRAPDPSTPTAQLADTVLTSGADGTASTTAIAGFHAGAIAITVASTGASAAFHLTSEAGPPATIAALPTSSPQAAQTGTAFGQPLVAVVQDEFGNPCAGVSVGFTVAAAERATISLSAQAATTGADGRAQITASAGATGAALIVATVPGLGAAAFGLASLASAPLTITASAGSGQSATVDTDLVALDALVVDSTGQPVASTAVTFAAPRAGATAQLAATTVATDATGHAVVAVHAGTIAGDYQIAARVAHAAAPASFALTNAPGAPAALVTSPLSDGQSATIDTPYAAALDVAALDAFGNAIPGIAIDFTAPPTGATGALSSPSAITDATGHARVTLTAGATAGEFAVTAATPGVPAASFQLANLSGGPVRLDVSSGAPQAAIVATGFAQPLVARVLDAAGDPLVGVAVTFTAPGAGATAQLSPVTAFTDADGDATALATAGNLAGGFAVIATTPEASAPIAFALVGQAGAPLTAAMVPTSTPQGAVVGDLFGASLAIAITDAFGNPVPGVAVTYTAPSSTATADLSSLTVVSDLDGIAQLLALANPRPGSYSIAAEVSDLTELSFSLTNVVGPPAALVAVSGGGQHALASALFADPIALRVADAFGNPLTGVAVALSAPSSGASGTPAMANLVSDDRGLVSTTVTAGDVVGNFDLAATFAGGSAVQVGLTVDAVPTTTTVTAPDSTPVNEDVTAQIAVTGVLGTPSGTVQLLDDRGTVLATATLDSSGHATAQGAIGVRGTHTVVARYLAQGHFAASTSSATIQVVDDDGELTGAGTDCNAAGGRTGFGLLLLAAGFAIRRRRAMPLAAIVLLAAPRIAAAQEAGTRAIDRLQPASPDSEWFALDSVGFSGHVVSTLSITGDYGYRPLVIYNANTHLRADIVRNQLVLHFAGAVTLLDVLRLSASVPMSPFQNGESATFNGMSLASPTYAFGDTIIAADVRVAGAPGAPLRLAAGATAFLPTGHRDDYMSDGIFAGDGHALLAGSLGRIEYAALARVVLRERTPLAGEMFGSEARYGVALGVRLAGDRLVLGPELFGAVPLASGTKIGEPIEVGGSLHYQLDDSWRIGAGGTAGLIHAVGTPVARAMLSLIWLP